MTKERSFLSVLGDKLVKIYTGYIEHDTGEEYYVWCDAEGKRGTCLPEELDSIHYWLANVYFHNNYSKYIQHTIEKRYIVLYVVDDKFKRTTRSKMHVESKCYSRKDYAIKFADKVGGVIFSESINQFTYVGAYGSHEK